MINLDAAAAPRRAPVSILPRWLSRRRALILAAVAVAAAGAWLGWPWLVAAGIAPILVVLAPCAVMCAVGACAMKQQAKPGESVAATADTPVAVEGPSAAQAAVAHKSDKSCCH